MVPRYHTSPEESGGDGGAGRGGSTGMVDGGASVPGEHGADTPGGGTVIENALAEAAPKKKRRAQKHNQWLTQ